MAKLTLNQVDKIIGDFRDNEGLPISFNTIDGETITITVKEHLDLPSMLQIVDNVTNGCFTTEGYAPEYRDVVFLKNVLEVMTNIPLPMKKSGEKDEHNKDIKIVDLAKLQEWNINNCLIGTISNKVPLIGKLEKLIDEKLEYTKQLIIHSNRNDEVIDGVVGIINKVNSIIDRYSNELENVDIRQMLPMLQKLSEDKLDRDAIRTILEVGNASKVEVKE